MAGERGRAHRSSEVQPGGRAPAPGSLALVQSFINSHYDLETEHGAELLASPSALSGWLSDHDLLPARMRATPADLTAALGLREALRDLARGNSVRSAPEPGALNRFAEGAGVELRFTARGPGFAAAPEAGVRGAFGLLLALTAQAMLEGRWSRLKICPGEDCGWAFYDHSRNGTGRWCSMAVCGGRAKARSHYQRRRGEA